MSDIAKSPCVHIPQYAVEALIRVLNTDTPEASREKVSRELLQHLVLTLEGLGATVTWAGFMSSTEKDD